MILLIFTVRFNAKFCDLQQQTITQSHTSAEVYIEYIDPNILICYQQIRNHYHSCGGSNNRGRGSSSSRHETASARAMLFGSQSHIPTAIAFKPMTVAYVDLAAFWPLS